MVARPISRGILWELKYLIAHLLSGSAKEFHYNLSRELSLRYHTLPLFERIPPHITIKAPFEADECGIAEIERVLRSFASGGYETNLIFSGFGHFGFRTVYLNVAKSPEAVGLVRRALKTLNENIPWLPRMPLEGNKLHASVARFLTRRQSRHVLRHLALMGQPYFKNTFDNIAILKKEGTAWKVHAFIRLRSSEDSGYAPAFQEEVHGERMLVP